MTKLFFLLALLSFSPVFGQDGFIAGKPELAYWKMGTDKTVVIVLHGGPGAAHGYLRPEFDALMAQATVIYYDQRGVGESENASSSLWQDHLHDLRRVIKTVADSSRIFLAGSSWGSTLAILYAHFYPDDVKGLILTGLYNWEGKGETYEGVRDTSTIYVRKGVIQLKEYKRDTVYDELGVQRLRFQNIIREAHIYSGGNETRKSIISAPPLDSTIIMQPVLIFRGTLKAGCGNQYAEEYASKFVNSELSIIQGGCHDPWLLNPEVFFAKCNEFLKKHKN